MFKVCEKQCDQCLFSKNKIVSGKRRNAILKECAEKDTHFICHKATINRDDVCCRGFYETMGPFSQMIRIAERLNAIEFVKV